MTALPRRRELFARVEDVSVWLATTTVARCPSRANCRSWLGPRTTSHRRLIPTAVARMIAPVLDASNAAAEWAKGLVLVVALKARAWTAKRHAKDRAF